MACNLNYMRRRMQLGAQPHKAKASGAVATFRTNLAARLDSLFVGVTPVQDLHGYENPWPAGGGVNILPVDLALIKARNTSGAWNNNVYSLNGVSFTVNLDNGGNVTGITANGTASAETSFDGSGVFIILANTNYRFDCWVDKTITDIAQYRMNGFTWYNSTHGAQGILNGSNFSTRFVIKIESGVTINSTTFKPTLVLGTVSPDAFIPYSNICPITGWTGCNVYQSDADTSNPTTIPISWQDEAGTVYGGTLEPVNGVLVVDRAMVNLGDLNWTKKTDGVYATTGIIGQVKEPSTYSEIPDIICSQYVAESYISLWSDRKDDSITVIWSASGSHGEVWVRDSAFTDETTFKQAMTDNSVQIVYALATPVTIQLDPVEIKTLTGTNNLWADCGNVDLSYWTNV